MSIRSGAERVLNATRLYRPARDTYQRFFNVEYYRARVDARQHFRQFVPPGGLVFDVGANRGELTATFLDLDARVIAVEANPHLAELVRRRYRSRRLVVEACAAGERPGTATLNLAEYDEHSTLSGEWRDLVPDRWTESIEVRVRTLDDLIDQYGLPDFVKIDVEGYEPQVLAGLSRQPAALSFEFRGQMIDATHACLARLSDIGAYEFAAPPPAWTDADGIMELIAPLEPTVSGDIYARIRAA